MLSQTGTRGGNQRREPLQIECNALARFDDVQLRLVGRGLSHMPGALLCAAFAVEHVGTGNFVVAAAHQPQLHLVLHVFNVEGAARRARAHQRAYHLLRERFYRFAHAGRGRAVGAVHRQESLHHGDGNLVGFKRNHRAVASDDLVIAQVAGRLAQRLGCVQGAEQGRDMRRG